MSRLPENKEHQRDQKRKNQQDGEHPANDDTGRDAADAGLSAAGDRDFGVLYANISGLPLDDYPADEPGAPNEAPDATTMLTRDRNLSGVVRTIQDEGPSDYEEEDRAGGGARQAVEAPGFSGRVTSSEYDSTPETGTAGTWLNFGRRLFGSRLAIYGTLLGILVLFIIIGVMDGDGEYLQGTAPDGESKYYSPPAELTGIPGGEVQPVAPVIDHQASDFRLRELQQLQLQINARLDDLENTVATLADENSRQRVANAAALDAIREQQRREQALITSRLDALQKETASRSVAVAAPEVSARSPAVQAVKSGPPPARDGNWAVNLASFQGETQARGLLETLKTAGIPVEQQTITLDGKTRYRLRVTGFNTRDEAKRYAGNLDKGLGLKDPWVSRR